MNPSPNRNPALAAALAAVFCALASIFQLYIGASAGGIPPEFVLFATLSLVFTALWYARRGPGGR